MVADHEITRDELFAVGATFTLVAWGFAHAYTVCQAIEPRSFTAAIGRLQRSHVGGAALPELHHLVEHRPQRRGAGESLRAEPRDDRAAGRARLRGGACLPARGPYGPAPARNGLTALARTISWSWRNRTAVRRCPHDHLGCRRAGPCDGRRVLPRRLGVTRKLSSATEIAAQGADTAVPGRAAPCSDFSRGSSCSSRCLTSFARGAAAAAGGAPSRPRSHRSVFPRETIRHVPAVPGEPSASRAGHRHRGPHD